MAEEGVLKKLQKETEERRKEYLEFLKKEKEKMRKIQQESKARVKEFLAWHKAYIGKHFPRKKVKRK